MSTLRLCVFGAVALVAVLGIVALAAHRPAAPTFVETDETFVESARARCERGTPEAKGEAALKLVRFPYQALNYEVKFLPGRKGYLAITYTGRDLIEIYVRNCQGVGSVANIAAHELGHAVDDRYMTGEERDQFQRVRGYAVRTWYGCSRCTDYATPAGDFAETFAFIHGPPAQFRSRMASPPSLAQADELGPLYLADAPPAPTTTTTVAASTLLPVLVP